MLEVTKIQILKVIHNPSMYLLFSILVVGSHKDTNFESNSQQSNLEQEKIFPKDKEVEKGNFY